MSLPVLLNNLRSLYVVNKVLPCVNSFSSKTPPQGVIKRMDPNTGELQTKKTNIIPKITLMCGDSISVTTLEEAQKISKRRELKLVKITDPDAKTQRPVYKLMSGAEYHAEDLKQHEQRKKDRLSSSKGEKVLLINSKIAQHDLETQLRKAMKWIKKMYDVKVVISGSGGTAENSERVYAFIEQYFKGEEGDAKVTNKRNKGLDIKFSIFPPRYKERDDDL